MRADIYWKTRGKDVTKKNTHAHGQMDIREHGQNDTTSQT